MIVIKTPDKYIKEPGLLKSAGEHISKLGKRALIVGGKKALSAAGEEFLKSLRDSDILFEIIKFQGHPTIDSIAEISSAADKFKADIIIGVGGGSVLDSVKAAGEKSSLSVVTVPTIAATCAAWSALTVLYNEEGKQTGYIILEDSPKLILADTKILAEAPVRYLNAGIGDTLVKWYEFAPYQSEANDDFTLKLGLNTAKLALKILKENAVLAGKEAENGVAANSFSEVVDSVIILAGLVGSINGGSYRAALGHAIHNSLTGIHETHGSLHGEKVIFGLIVQFILEGKPQEEIDDLIDFLNKLELPVTLEQLGITENSEEVASDIAKGVNIKGEALDKLNFRVDRDLIEKAIITADKLGQSSLKKRVVA